jgi:hypothetical protein
VTFNKALAETLFIYDPPSINSQKYSLESYENENKDKNENKNISHGESRNQKIFRNESNNKNPSVIPKLPKKRQYKKVYPHISSLKLSRGLVIAG